jgi:protein subunit release factor A
MNKKEIIKLEKNGIEKNQKEIAQLKKNLEYNIALITRQKDQRAFEDKWREFLRNQKDEEDSKVLKIIESEIKIREETISNSEKQLNKYPIGV